MYEKTANWESEFYPAPYDFLAPPGSHALRAPVLGGGNSGWGGGGGLGCADGKPCGGACCGGHQSGLGLFESGLDYSQWSYVEWSLVAIGSYLVLNVASDAMSAGKSVNRVVQRQRRKRSIKEKYQRELAAA